MKATQLTAILLMAMASTTTVLAQQPARAKGPEGRKPDVVRIERRGDMQRQQPRKKVKARRAQGPTPAPGRPVPPPPPGDHHHHHGHHHHR